MSRPRAWKRRKAARGATLVLGTAPDLSAWRANNYAPALLALARRAGELGPGVHDVDVAHDDSCGIWHGGTCDCRPMVRLRGDPHDN